MTKGKRLQALFTALAIAALPLLAACETAPATGRTFFTGGMSAEDEARVGAEQHEKIVPQFGGQYDDPELAAYVSSIGDVLARTSELPDLKFTFTVLDSHIVNAFALPGGYVYVTRGLVALANDEAELAGVVGHEIGHVTARHSAERYGQSIAATVATIGAGIFLGREAGQLVNTVGGLAVRAYSRDQEFEADTLGIRYLARSNYEPLAMAGFLDSLQAHSRLEAERAGQPGKADEFSLLQTHPRTSDRVREAGAKAGTTAVSNPITGRDVYLRKIDGMIYGDSPAQGFVRGRRFIHTPLRLAFEVPEGFRIINSAQQVAAKGPDGAALIFDQAPKWQGEPPERYLVDTWAAKADLKDVERITINGMPAATARTRIRGNKGLADFRLVAVQYDAKRLYRFLFVTPAELTAKFSRHYRETTYSFRKLSAAEAARIKPRRIGIHRVRRGETPAALARTMAVDDHKLEEFLVLNGMTDKDTLQAGQLVKVVRE